MRAHCARVTALCNTENTDIMTTEAMNNLWQYLQGLSLSRRNRKWLAERLVSFEEEKEAAPTLMTKAQYFARLDEAEQGESHAMLHEENVADYLKRRGYDI